jgi:hypothetical protein
MKILRSVEIIHSDKNQDSPFCLTLYETSCMRHFRCDSPLVWGKLDLPVMGMDSDWYGAALAPPLCFTLASDSSYLWFVATRKAPATCRPGAEPGSFTEGLWEQDVAELFLADPTSGAYLEFNLAPNGAWWAAIFSAPRVRNEQQPDFPSIVTSYWEVGLHDAWCSAIRVPLAFLEKEIGFSAETTANATAILNSPLRTFHSAHKLPGKEPDFHQPSLFRRLTTIQQ